MASANGKSKTPKQPSVAEMAARLAQLELENKSLKKRIKNGNESTPPKDENILSSYQKEAMITAAVSKLSAMASKKIELKVRDKLAAAVTKQEVEHILRGLTVRIETSLSDLGERGHPGDISARRGRASSRGRERRDSEKRDS